MDINKAQVPTLPRIRYMSCVNLTRRSRCNSSSQLVLFLLRTVDWKPVSDSIVDFTSASSARHPITGTDPQQHQVLGMYLVTVDVGFVLAPPKDGSRVRFSATCTSALFRACARATL